MKKIALVALAFVAFSCSDEKEKELKKLTIAEVAKATGDFSEFSRALDTLGLASTFESAGDYTVFVPDNNAISTAVSALGYPTLDEVFANTEARLLLTNILKYHVVNSRVLSTSLTNDQSVSTLYGQNFTVTIQEVADGEETYPGEVNRIYINGNNSDTQTTALVKARDVQCTNGIIHPIDAVIIPAFSAGKRR